MKSRIFGVLVLSTSVLVLANFGAPSGWPQPQQPRIDTRHLLSAVGGLGVSHLHQTYLNIGLVADAKAKGVYDAKDADEILRGILALHAAVDGQFDKLGKLDLDAADRATLDRLRAISTVLGQQGKELQVYWETDIPERGVNYEKLRRQAWDEISKLSKSS